MASVVLSAQFIDGSRITAMVSFNKDKGINTSMALTEFELFLKLPLELRRKVWKMALPGPRVIEVKFVVDGRKNNHRFCAKIPVLLHVSQESRTEAMREYPQAFKHPRSLNGCYFSYELDTLYIPQYTTPNQQKAFVSNKQIKNDIARVQNLAVQYGDFIGKWGARRIPDYFFSFQNLHRVELLGCFDYQWSAPHVARSIDIVPIGTMDTSYKNVDQLKSVLETKVLAVQTELQDPKYNGTKGKNTWRVPMFLIKKVQVRMWYNEGRHLFNGGAMVPRARHPFIRRHADWAYYGNKF